MAAQVLPWGYLWMIAKTYPSGNEAIRIVNTGRRKRFGGLTTQISNLISLAALNRSLTRGGRTAPHAFGNKDYTAMAKVESATRVDERSVESSASAIEWSAIFAGGVAAMGITLILLTLGPGLGLTAVSPWSFRNPSPVGFGTAAAIWLVVTQWLSSAFGGYLTGRLRKKWVGIRTDEVLFRDTAHGLLAWALATLIMAALITLGSATAAGVAATAAGGLLARRPQRQQSKHVK